MSGPHLRRALGWSTVASSTSRIIGALGGILAARALDPAARGDLAVLVVVATIGSIVLAGGVQFWIAREVARTDSLHVGRAVARHHCAVVSLSGGVLTLLLAPFLVDSVLDAGTYLATMLLAITGAIFLVVLALPNGARAMGRFAAAMTVGAVVYTAGIALVALLGVADVATILWFAVVGNLAAVAVVLTRRTATAAPVVAIDARGRWWESLRFGIAGGASELVLFGMLRVDILLLAMLRPASQVGAYAIATSLTEMLWIVPDATVHVALPTAADRADAPLLPAVFRIATATTLVLGVVLVTIAGPLIAVVFGPGYEPGVAAVPYLAAAAVLGGAWKILSAEVAGRQGTHARLTSAGLGLAVMVVVDLLLIPLWGIRGAGIGAFAGYAVATAAIVAAWRAEPGNSVRSLVGVRTTDLDVVRGRVGRTLEHA